MVLFPNKIFYNVYIYYIFIKEEDVGSYWMTLRKGKNILICRRKLWIALCGELALEESLDLSYDRLLNE
jgi:hypothetical protein